MKITIYELLGLVKDGKAPKKIIYRNVPMIYDDGVEDYIPHQTDKFHGNDLFHYLFEEEIKIFLNDEVEIIEEEKRVPEKLSDKVINGKICGTYATDLDVAMLNKINEIIDYLKSKVMNK